MINNTFSTQFDKIINNKIYIFPNIFYKVFKCLLTRRILCNKIMKKKERTTIMTDLKNKIEMGMKPQALHDEFCPHFEPDWENTTVLKFYIYLNNVTNRYSVGYVYDFCYAASVWFPDMRVAYKVCNILNNKTRHGK